MNDYIAHYGIPGMKWGVRRYQNKDRSYTAEGKKRYGDPAKWSDDYKESQKLSKKHVNEMMNDELERLNKRQSMAREYQRNNPTNSKLKKGIKYTATAVAAYLILLRFLLIVRASLLKPERIFRNLRWASR